MQAILTKAPGGPEQLSLGESPTPLPGEQEIRIQVKAAALNRADLLQREGKYPPPPGASPILGLDVAGVVESVGSRVSRWKPGEKVMALLSGGGYAEYAVVHEDLAMAIPHPLGFEAAAAIPEVFLTAFQTLFYLGKLGSGERVLIHAGASGVGTAAIQLAREAHAASVLITAGSHEKIRACQMLGADHGFNYKEGPWWEAWEKYSPERGMDLILDFIGAPYWEPNLKALAPEGRLVLIAAMGGVKVEKFNLLPFLLKRIQVMGTTLRSRSLEYKIQLTEDFCEFALPRFITGRLKPMVDRVFDWGEVREAHRYMQENKNIGKIVLRVG